ncbi:MAG: M20/M25/M40 family metallo-hydrolase [Hyphomicrobiales bacterium]|nr:M20/M25/M40 family metallo-hydrolase [Hyphomicrobiales bacterium]MCP4998752.1 M20/M25/M40 family metallo-hydrolase [Hyphomicrobiales bacterium]
MQQPVSPHQIETACRDAEAASIDLLQNLIATTKAGSDAVDEVIAEAIAAFGGDAEPLTYDPSKVPLVGEFAVVDVASTSKERCLISRIEGDGSGQSLILFAHPDVESPGTGAGWSTDPHTPTVREGKLYGWGVADDLAGIAIMLQVAAVLKETGIRLRGDLFLVSAPSKAHRRGIAAALHDGLRADAALYLHPAESGRGLDEIKAFSPGQLEFQITIRGRPPQTLEPAHTAFAHRAVNPFDKAIIIASVLRELDHQRGASIHHQRLEKAIGRSVNLMLTRCDFADADSTSRIPDECRLFGALSLVPGEDLNAVMGSVEEAVGRTAEADPWMADHPPELQWRSGISAAETPDEHEFYKLAMRELTRLGAKPQVNPLHTASDIRNPIVQKGIPTVGFGPKCGGLAMSGLADEWVDVEDYFRSIAAAVAMVVNWCGQHHTDRSSVE